MSPEPTTEQPEQLVTLALDLKRQKPWLDAQPDSLWNITKGQFIGMDISDSIACADGNGVFKLLSWGIEPGFNLGVDNIQAAQELIPVFASEPLTALYVRDQPLLDKALERRDES